MSKIFTEEQMIFLSGFYEKLNVHQNAEVLMNVQLPYSDPDTGKTFFTVGSKDLLDIVETVISFMSNSENNTPYVGDIMNQEKNKLRIEEQSGAENV
jgi:hypothetical protein